MPIKSLIFSTLIIFGAFAGTAMATDNEEIMVWEAEDEALLAKTPPKQPAMKADSDDQQERCTWSNFCDVIKSCCDCCFTVCRICS